MVNQAMTFGGKTLLFIGAHPDDIELGCGALLAQIAGRANLIGVTLSDNQNNPELKDLVSEHYASMSFLGFKKENVILKQFETRSFPRDRQEILEYLITLNQKFDPDIVFCHSKADIHQDHAIITNECLRAFRGVSLLGFDVIRSSYGFFPNFLVEVSEDSVEKKCAALRKYITYKGKYYFSDEITKATLIRNGALVERPYAEGFEILRIVGKFTA